MTGVSGGAHIGASIVDVMRGATFHGATGIASGVLFIACSFLLIAALRREELANEMVDLSILLLHARRDGSTEDDWTC